MPILAMFNRTAPVFLPAALVLMLIVGLSFPVYDYIQARKKARRDAQPLPRPSFLLAEIAESQILAYLLCAVGLLMLLGCLILLLPLKGMTFPKMASTVAILGGGFGCIALSQYMLRRFARSARSWRAAKRKRG